MPCHNVVSEKRFRMKESSPKARRLSSLGEVSNLSLRDAELMAVASEEVTSTSGKGRSEEAISLARGSSSLF